MCRQLLEGSLAYGDICKVLPAIRHHVVGIVTSATAQVQHEPLPPNRSNQILQATLIDATLVKYVGSDDHVAGAATEVGFRILRSDPATNLHPPRKRRQGRIGCLLAAGTEHDHVSPTQIVVSVSTCHLCRGVERFEVGDGALTVLQCGTHNLNDMAIPEVDAGPEIHARKCPFIGELRSLKIYPISPESHHRVAPPWNVTYLSPPQKANHTMHDPRYDQLADLLTGHSTHVDPGENVLIEATDIPDEMVIALIRSVRRRGGHPLVTVKHTRIQRELIQGTDDEGTNLGLIGDVEAFRMEKIQAYVALRGNHNISELSDVPPEAMRLYETRWLRPVHFGIRVPKTKWCVLRWPTPSMAQQAEQSTEAFENFYFDVCTLDYGRMASALEPLVNLITGTDRVRITGPNTDLTFRIEGIPVIGCSGQHNVPDGECYTAPIRDSVEGRIVHNTPTIYRGTRFSEIDLTFEKGRIVKATADRPDELAAILDSDEGARYIGEFAIGFNPYITEPMLDILFDEKIAGSFHFTPGQAYEWADNGNRSAVHWDMVTIQTPEFGGGEIWFDNQLIRKDGRFVIDELEELNPENLK